MGNEHKIKETIQAFFFKIKATTNTVLNMNKVPTNSKLSRINANNI